MKSITGLILCCCIFGMTETARSFIFTGFPWALFGYGWDRLLSMKQIGALIGVYGLTLLTLFWGMGLGLLWGQSFRNKALSIAIIATMSICALYGHGRLLYTSHQMKAQNKNTPIYIAVQPNIDQAEKWDSEKEYTHFLKILDISNKALESLKSETRPIYMLWPETAISRPLLDHPIAHAQIQDLLSKAPSLSLLSGILWIDGDDYYNSLIALSQGSGYDWLYHKHHLVPFGEYLPFQSLIPIAALSGFEGLKKGDKAIEITQDHHRFYPQICYESLFPATIAPLSPEKDKEDAAIINVTNDAWYGNSAGPYQHLSVASFRAIETGLPMIRSANTGITAIIDPTGAINESLRYGIDGYVIQDDSFVKIQGIFKAEYHHRIVQYGIYILNIAAFLFLRYGKNILSYKRAIKKL
jgi:apolipoprotein N-acyltransferase